MPDETGEEIGLLDAPFEDGLKTVLRQKLDILGEHGEEAAHEKQRDLLGVVELLAVLALRLLQMLGDLREPFRDLAGRLGRDLGRVELVRIEPDRAQPLADVVGAQILEKDPKVLPVGKLRIIFSLAGEIGIELEAMADVANDQEGWPAFRGRERLGVVLRLAPGVDHEDVPGARGRAAAVRGRLLRLGLEEIALLGLLGAGPAALLRLEDEAAALVEVDSSARCRAVQLAEGHPALEDIGVGVRVVRGGLRTRHAQRVAEFGQEQRVVGALLPAVSGRPMGHEGLEIGNRHGVRLAELSQATIA